MRPSALGLFLALTLIACAKMTGPSTDAGTSDAGAPDAGQRVTCGSLGHACGPREVCSEGRCVSTCPTGTTDCNGDCVDLQTNKFHCSACTSACRSDEFCVSGTCGCGAGYTRCGVGCVSPANDHDNCGSCGHACAGDETCSLGTCVPSCPSPKQTCDGGGCFDLSNSLSNCGACGRSCVPYQEECVLGQCLCAAGLTRCASGCVELGGDQLNCGMCGQACGAHQHCLGGSCVLACQAPTVNCGGQCVTLANDPSHCGGCNIVCGAGQVCANGQCLSCGPNVDCDQDGWTPNEGDCCDTPGTCLHPAEVNPGAIEVNGNGFDENCNGLVDAADTLDTQGCDTGLQSNTTASMDYARALGLCRTTAEVPLTPQLRTWGVISVELLHADGTPLTTPQAASIREEFGLLRPLEGKSLAVLASGLAADETQTNPGPDTTRSEDLNATSDLATCTSPACISDWYFAARPPLKPAHGLPVAPGCGMPGPGDNLANDSVMLKLRLRAPTNAGAFTLKGFFFSDEYPEFVCSQFNDQVVVLVDTPGNTVTPPNPPDKNLMTYQSQGKLWPIGINLAGGTGLFRVCETQATNPSCWQPQVSSLSCALGPAQLAGTGFEANGGTGTCVEGGGTGWLTTLGNVAPGRIVEVRIAIWDVGDHILDSKMLLDAFTWQASAGIPGTD